MPSRHPRHCQPPYQDFTLRLPVSRAGTRAQTVKLLKQRDTRLSGSLMQSMTGGGIGMHVTGGMGSQCDPQEGPGHSYIQHTQVSARGCPEAPCLCPQTSGGRGGLGTPAPPLTATL